MSELYLNAEEYDDLLKAGARTDLTNIVVELLSAQWVDFRGAGDFHAAMNEAYTLSTQGSDEELKAFALRILCWMLTGEDRPEAVEENDG